MTGLVVVHCCGCGRAITRGQRGLKGNGNALCLNCLGARQAPFAERLRAYRLAAGLTQDELAQRSGLSATSVWQYEQGEAVPRAGTLARLVEILGSGLAPPATAAVRARPPRQVAGR